MEEKVDAGNFEGLSSKSSLQRLAIIFVAYFVANRIALIFPDAENILAVVWPAAGIGLAALLLAPRPLWPALLATIFLAGNIANLSAGRPLLNSLGFMTANVLESLGCALVLTSWGGTKICFCRVREIVLLGLGALGVNAVTGLVGAGTACMAGIAPFFSFWGTWVIADGLGIFLVTPLIVAWVRTDCEAFKEWRSALETGAFFILFGFFSVETFQRISSEFMFNPGPYVLIALLAWPALRLGTRVVTLSTNLLAVVAVVQDVAYFGSLTHGASNSASQLLLVQLYIWSAAITAYILHALSRQRDATEQSLKESMEWFQALISQSQDGIMVLGFDGRPRMANKRACENLGYSELEFLALHVRDWDPDFIKRNDAELFWSNLPVTLEGRHRRKDGSIFPVEITISRIESHEEPLMMGVIRDISERKQIEAALRESETNFRTLIETMADMIAVVDLNGRVIFVNPAVCNVLGYSFTDLVGMRLDDVYPYEIRGRVSENFDEVQAGHKVVKNSTLRCKNGTLLPVETRGWLGSWNGEPCVFGISKDLNAEQEAQQRFEKLFHNNPALMSLSQMPERTFIDVNATVVKTLGYSREELLGHKVAELNLFVDIAQQEAMLARIAEDGFVSNFELQVRCKDGSIRDGMFSGEIISSLAQNYLLMVMIDITERKQAEHLLQSSEERLAMALRGSNAGLWDWNVVTGETVYNERWAEMLGYSLDELRPLCFATWQRLCHPEDKHRAELKLQQHFNGETDFYECELRMKHKDGRWVWIQDRGKCLEWTEDGKPQRMVGTHIDISMRKQNEELREDIERIIKHDLRTPAGSAVNIARLLADSPTMSDEDKLLAMQLERAGKDMLDTLNLSLELYKIESGSVEYQYEDIRLFSLVNEVVDGLRVHPQHREKYFDIMINPFDFARGVLFLLRMSLQNLIQNALEAIATGETVHIRAVCGDMCVITIRNKGVVSPEIRDRFFEKYVTSGKYNGTGLGTYSAKIMVEIQGGTVNMNTSEILGETEISVVIPLGCK